MPKKVTNSKKQRSSKISRTSTPDSPIFCIYLYHFVGFTLNKQYEIFNRSRPVYTDGDLDQDVQITISAAIDNAVNRNTPQYYCGSELQMFMRRKSLLVFAIETKGTIAQNGDLEIRSYKGNEGEYTFGPAKYFTTTQGGKNFLVTYCLNLLKSTDEEDLADLEFERFSFSLPYQKRGKPRGDPGTGGTNQGPPVGPPDRKKNKR